MLQILLPSQFTNQTGQRRLSQIKSSTGSAEVDEITVSTLQRWKFKPQRERKTVRICQEV